MSKGGPIASHIDIRTAWNVPNNENLSILFCRGISDGEKKVLWNVHLALQDIVDIQQLEGDWWVLKGN